MEQGVAVVIMNSFTKEVGVITCKNYKEAEKCLHKLYFEALLEAEDYVEKDTYINKDKRYAQIRYGFEITEFRTGELWPSEQI